MSGIIVMPSASANASTVEKENFSRERRFGVSWDYRIENSARKNLHALGPSVAEKIRHYLDTRIRGCANPRAFGKPLRHDLKGYWRYQVADCRLICRLEDHILTVLVVKVGNRKNVYKKKK